MRAGAAEIIPGKLYQRGNFLTWPRSQKWRFMEERGITMVLNMWTKIDPDMSPEPGDLGRIYINWLCSPSEVPQDANLMVGFCADMVNAGQCLLVHCEAGRGRSVWFAARVCQALRLSREPRTVAEEVLAAVGSYDVREVLAKDLGLGAVRHKS